MKPVGRLVHRLIEAQAEQTPDAVAVVWDGGTYTFRQLDQRATVLATLLVERGVRPERLVGVSMEPSPLLLVAMFAIWKAGGAYVPIDASLPRDVAEGMVSDAGVTLLIGNGPVAVDLAGVHTIDLDGLDLSSPPTALPSVELHPSNLAYCVFTSGSTGKPKLVAAAHASFVNHARALRDQLSLGPQDRSLQSTAMAFDAALEEILPAWLAGGAVVMPAQSKFTSWEFTGLIERLSVTMVSLPSAYWHLWVDDLVAGVVSLPPSLRTVFIGGDKILVDKLTAWYGVPGAERINWVSDYGPTETSISVALHHPARDGIGGSDGSDYALVSLGRAFAQAALYILDDELRLVPDGEPGDLWVGGPPVTRGYYGAPAMTADRYRPDPQGSSGARMYRTGDRAARMPDGTLSFLGRSDRQVKIRGQRVELGQVESALHQLDGVTDAVAVVVQNRTAGSSLVAYVETGPDVSEAEIKARLVERLPESALPTHIVLLDKIPRSPLNGKVSRAALPSIGEARACRLDVAAMTTLERAVAMVVADVLGVSVSDRHEDVFSIGGDSLQGMQILSRVAEVTGVALTFTQFRAAPHVAGIAASVTRLRGAGAAEYAIAPAANREEWQPASRGQQALWYLDKVHRGAPLYAIPVCYRIRGPLDIERLDAALTAIVTRHEALRTVLVQKGGTVWQHVRPAEPVRTEVVRADDFTDAAERVQTAAGGTFDLGTGPLLRSSAFQFDGEWLWLLDVHHAVFDAWSLAVFWHELAALYEGRPLPDVAVQYADYVVWQQRWLAGPEAAAQRAYWSTQLTGAPEPAQLGTGRAAGARVGTDGFALRLPPSAIDTAAVKRVAQECRSTPYTVLLASFFLALSRAIGTDEPVVGLPVACRNRPGTENIIGYLVNTVAVRARLNRAMSFRDVVADVDAAMAEALTNQDLPFADAADGASRSARAGAPPIFQAMFGFQSTPLDSLDGIAGLTIVEHFVHSGTAKTALTWTARNEATGLVGEIEYAADAFDTESAAQWQADLMATLDAALAEPDQSIGTLLDRSVRCDPGSVERIG
ncbi:MULTISPECIES: non-ribosomal peptide synthetase [Actinoalloteichus]|uniref:Amino acid adenylation enzyme/thioester reductase family protein n=1 Tax=Actinoalloteichus fjordicus TaxID=1612552 RepID=A0AAC9L8H0_9PSEU|nr:MULTISPECIES: non-ribosomal peptide synthetase [Actinoalloteichus]APU13108.1 amino acid adenylation enzyme/thioester reductase family protein [Actinoalloteichus fjordicus]APU19059.1 amino acid adenylation enzyme/thioester reductase family protein [Actinoalloteichus sp. GBA129-24]